MDCPYKDNRCPKDIPLDERGCCDNEYTMCPMFQQYENDRKELMEDESMWNWWV